MLLMLCMVMQCVMLFPHHHHPGRSGVCMNLLHCTESHADCRDHEGRSCGPHSHDTPGDVCGFSDLILSQPQREDSVLEWMRIFDLPADTGALCALSSIVAAESDESETVRMSGHERPFVTPLHLLFITQASLLRAPTCFA